MRRFEHGGNIYTGTRIISDFSININPMGMPEGVKNALVDHVDGYDIYPDPRCLELRSALAAYLSSHTQTEAQEPQSSGFDDTDSRATITPDMVICGNGADDLIYRTCYALRPEKVLVCAPGFSEYEKASLAAGAQIVYHHLKEENGFVLTDEILNDITEDIDLVFVCTPNNPTGRTVDRELIRRIAQACKVSGAYFMLDECFICFTQAPSSRDMLKDFDNMMILDAFTKRYAAAGLRLGFLQSSDAELLERIYNAGPCWNVSTPAQVAGIAALAARDYLPESVRFIRQEREFLTDRLTELGIKVYPSEANYLLLKTEIPLYDLLRQKGILIRACDNYIGLDETYFRICVKQREEELLLVDAIREVMNG